MYLLGHSSVLGTISRLHGYWADKAGANWDGVAGHNAVELAQMFHIEIDSAKTGDFQQIPYRLSTVAAPDYDPHHQHKSRKSTATLGALCAESARELFRQISLVSPLFFARALWQIALPPLGGVAAICHRPLGV
jgi:hypothetical protein